MWFGAPPHRRRSDGMEIGACRALYRALRAARDRHNISHGAVAFDHVIESFRNDLFAGYKTGEGMDPDLFGQFDLAERVAQAAGITAWPMVEFEADDALATGAVAIAKDARVKQVRIAAVDKDLAQVVTGDRIVMWNRFEDRIMNTDGVAEKYGVAPGSIPDWLALVGDDADGIPGIPRWGARGAAAVLAHYQNLDRIPVDCNEWPKGLVRGAASLSAQLEAHRKEARLYRQLATLRIDAPLDTTLEALEWRSPTAEASAEIEVELELG